jgi:sty sbli
MNEYVLSSMVEIISGGTPKTDKPEYWNGNIGWLSVADFNNVERFVYDSDKTITSKGLQESNTKLLKKGDVIISARGTVGALAQIGKEMAFNQSCFGLRAKPEYITNDFLFYALKNYIKNFKAKSTGSVFETINISSFDLMKLSVPCLKKQQSIAAVLSALDKKIALNKQINARLEQMAKTLYDYWFVQFDFPDANGKPYKSSGGEMVFDETLKREIPKGWKSGNILNIANLLGGGTPSKSSPKYWNGNIPFFTPTDCDNSIFILDTADRITDAGLCNSSTRLFKKHSIFITARGSVGRSSINAVPMAMNQSCYAFQAKENVSYTFLFFLIRELIMILEVKATGSVFNSIVSSDIETTNLVISNKDLIRKFGEYCEPLFNQIETNLKQNHQLTQLRDFLLPMLMNGQVSVAE